MSNSIFTKIGDEITCPMMGTVTVLNANTTAQVQDLGACGNQTQDMRNEDALPVAGGYTAPGSAATTQQNLTLGGLIGKFVEFYADGGDVGILFAANSASFTASTAANLAASGVNTAGCCLRIPAGGYRSFVVHPTSRWLSYITANSTSNLRITPTSRAA